MQVTECLGASVSEQPLLNFMKALGACMECVLSTLRNQTSVIIFTIIISHFWTAAFTYSLGNVLQSK